MNNEIKEKQNNSTNNKIIHCKWKWQERCDEYENCIFKFKFLILIAIGGALFLSIILFLIGGIESIKFFILNLLDLIKYIMHDFISTKSFITEELDVQVLSITDTFLFGIVMLIFALGSYNLFISKLDNVTRDMNHDDMNQDSENRHNKISKPKENNSQNVIPGWLRFTNFSELKELFIKVIILILAILFLKNLIELGDDIRLEKIIYLSLYPISILFISWSIRLMSCNNSEEKKNK